MLILCIWQVLFAVACRRHNNSADGEDRDYGRPGLLGDGPTAGRQFPGTYDDNDDDYYYDETEHNYDDNDGDYDEAGCDNVDESYVDADTAKAASDIGQFLYCTRL